MRTAELIERSLAGKQVDPVLEKDPVLTIARDGAALVGCQDHVVAGEGRGVAIGIGQEATLLFGAGKQVGPPAMAGAPAAVAQRPSWRAGLHVVAELDRAIAVESQGRIAWGKLDSRSGSLRQPTWPRC